MVNVKDLQDVVDDLKDQASKRASDILGEGKTQVRSAIGGHTDGELVATLVLGILLGAIVGAALSLLFSPISGQEARRKLGENVERMRGPEPVGGNGASRQPTSVGDTSYRGTVST
jgi:hypothetical protein